MVVRQRPHFEKPIDLIQLPISMRNSLVLFLFVFIFVCGKSLAQGLYTAKGYWDESGKPAYQTIKQKQIKGDSLNKEETTYLSDFETYLANYFQRLPDEEKQKYEAMKEQWSRDQVNKNSQSAADTNQNTFQWKNRDRFTNASYGIYYGFTLGYMAELSSSAGFGLSLITGGLMLLGPAINPKRYKGISRTTIEAQSRGRLLGLGYGAGLGIALIGVESESEKIILPLSSLGSIILGEIGFQYQKKKKIGAGEIGMMSHYGTLIPLAGISLLAANEVNSARSYGLTIFGAGIGGIFIGRKVSKSFSFTGGDVDAISSLAWISGGIGFTAVAATFENNNNASSGLIMVPAAAAILGTIIGQKQLKNAHLTDQQGSTLVLASAGAGLVGLGVAIAGEFESATAVFGLPTALALLTHQILLSNFKMNNLKLKLKSGLSKKENFRFSINVNPENYFIGKRMGPTGNLNFMSQQVQNPIFKLRVTF